MPKSKITLFLVEDEALVLSLMDKELTALGYKVVGQSMRGPDALKNIPNLKPDFLLVDIQLKGKMTGIEVAKTALKKWKIPAIFLTSYSDAKTLEKARKADPYGYLLKPINFKEVHATVQMAINKRELNQKFMASETEKQKLKQEALEKRTKALEKALAEQRKMVESLRENRENLIDGRHDQLEKCQEELVSLLRFALDGEDVSDLQRQFCVEFRRLGLNTAVLVDIYGAHVEELVKEFSEYDVEDCLFRLRTSFFDILVELGHSVFDESNTTPFDLDLPDTLDQAGLPLALDGTDQELRMFQDDVVDHIEAINNGLVQLEEAGADSASIVAELFRCAHTVKGNSAAVKHDRMVRLTHQIETIFDDIRSGKLVCSGEVISRLLKGLDVLKALNEEVRDQKQSGIMISTVLIDLYQLSAGSASGADQAAIAQSSVIRLSASELEKLSLGQRRGQTPYQLAVVFESDCALPGASATAVIHSLSQHAQVIGQMPTESEMVDYVGAFPVLILVLTTLTPEKLKDIVQACLDVENCEVSPWIPPKSADQGCRRDEILKVDARQLDWVANKVGELATVNSRIYHQLSELDESKMPEIRQTQMFQEQSQRLVESISYQIETLRLVPAQVLFSKFPRIVRDLSVQLKKEAKLVLEGRDLRLNKLILEQLLDPLTHLIRNAVDHGLESPKDRLAAQKYQSGVITLRAVHAEGGVCIEIEDDGQGLDRDKIGKKAVEQGLIDPEQLEGMSDAEVYKVIFMGGFSTAETLSSISGRGVGMDIVKTKIDRLNGKIVIRSKPGQGTVIRVVLPSNIVDGLITVAGGELYLVPLQYVGRIFSPNDEDLHAVQDRRQVVHYDDQYLTLVDVREQLKHPPTPGIQTEHAKSILVALFENDRKGCLKVDQVLDKCQVVVKDLNQNLAKIDGILGTSILGDGRIIKVLDIPYLLNLVYTD